MKEQWLQGAIARTTKKSLASKNPDVLLARFALLLAFNIRVGDLLPYVDLDIQACFGATALSGKASVIRLSRARRDGGDGRRRLPRVRKGAEAVAVAAQAEALQRAVAIGQQA